MMFCLFLYENILSYNLFYWFSCLISEQFPRPYIWEDTMRCSFLLGSYLEHSGVGGSKSNLSLGGEVSGSGLIAVMPCTAWSKSCRLPGLSISLCLKSALWTMLIIKFPVPLNIFDFHPGNFYCTIFLPHPYPQTCISTFLESGYFTIKTHMKRHLSPLSPPSLPSPTSRLKYCH